MGGGDLGLDITGRIKLAPATSKTEIAFLVLTLQAVKDDIGSIRIQRPHKGPFYVSDKTIDQLIANLGKWSRFIFISFFLLLVYGKQMSEV